MAETKKLTSSYIRGFHNRKSTGASKFVRKTERSVSSQRHIQTPRSGLTKHSRGFKDQRRGVQISDKTLIKEFDIAFQMNHNLTETQSQRFAKQYGNNDPMSK